MSEQARDLTMAEVAQVLGMSERWVRKAVRDGAEHQRYGTRVRFTPAQVAALRVSHAVSKRPQAITTGRKRRSA